MPRKEVCPSTTAQELSESTDNRQPYSGMIHFHIQHYIAYYASTTSNNIGIFLHTTCYKNSLHVACNLHMYANGSIRLKRFIGVRKHLHVYYFQLCNFSLLSIFMPGNDCACNLISKGSLNKHRHGLAVDHILCPVTYTYHPHSDGFLSIQQFTVLINRNIMTTSFYAQSLMGHFVKDVRFVIRKM